ncbi:MAG: hypothetical protein WDN69_34145 [Aliidongia sp.]
MFPLLRRWRLALALLLLCPMAARAGAAKLCPDEQDERQLPPANPAYCAELDPIIRKPSAMPLDQYEAKLDDFIGHFCHRRLKSGWKMDKTVRDAGPFFGTLENGVWTGSERATHMPVLIWYSPEMMTWLKKYRPGGTTPAVAAPVPDGAIMIKEMYNSTPAAACQVPDLLKLKPVEQGAAVMIRDSAAAKDGWFWGWYGWPDVGSGWSVDYPPKGFGLPFMGFGQYCVNCHASARDNQTFASLDNIKGEHGSFLPFLSQDFYQTQSFGTQPLPVGPALGTAVPSEHLEVVEQALAPASTALLTLSSSNQQFMAGLELGELPPLAHEEAVRTLKMPSQTYDNVWVAAHGAKAAHAFVTADQCVGCHSAGGTGLQFEMTAPAKAPPAADTATLLNFSPYGTWRTSPMGLAGRDPIFFSQLASETQDFPPDGIGYGAEHLPRLPRHRGPAPIQHRYCEARWRLSRFPARDGRCRAFPERQRPGVAGAFRRLARDGVSCTACHHMVLSKADTARFAGQPQNRCVAQRQKLLNADNEGFARTFTGSFFIGDPDTLYGPFEDPKQVPMKHSFGIVPEHNQTIKSSEVCGTCHTVHLPVFSGKTVVAHSYEQTTYPEWAFSAYRTGDTPDGKLPFGAGALAQSCQGCHMPNADATGAPFRSKIAGIQEHSNFPAAENALSAAEIDLPVRTGFAKHVLVGLNVFFIEMAKQFNTVLGVPTGDPMLGKKGVPPLDLTEQAMLDQASDKTAAITVGGISQDAGRIAGQRDRHQQDRS